MAWVYLLYTGRVDSALRECFVVLYIKQAVNQIVLVMQVNTQKCDNSVLLYNT